MIEVEAFDHLVLNVADVERSLAWYRDELGLTPLRVDEWRKGDVPFPSVRVSSDTIIDLVGAERGGENVDHLCLVLAPVDLAAVAGSGRFDVVEGPVERWGSKGVGMSLYVRDPDGNVVELRHYG
jgi:catechol 2,3-dioxygenase-like lactoylglutathione lyase family enzyme